MPSIPVPTPVQHAVFVLSAESAQSAHATPVVHPFAALVNPDVVQAAAERAAHLNLPRRTSRAWSGGRRDSTDNEASDEDLEELDDDQE